MRGKSKEGAELGLCSIIIKNKEENEFAVSVLPVVAVIEKSCCLPFCLCVLCIMYGWILYC